MHSVKSERSEEVRTFRALHWVDFGHFVEYIFAETPLDCIFFIQKWTVVFKHVFVSTWRDK